VSLAIHRCRKPTIGAIQGAAVGVGITMALPMHLRIAHKDAKIGFVFARRGLVLEAASSFFLPRLLGISKALALTTTGNIYPASHRMVDGLFAEFCDTPQEVLPRALAVAKDIADNCSNVSITLMRELLYRGTDSAEEQHLLDSRILYSMFKSKDNEEGVASFLEKRKVNFTGTVDNDAPAAYPWWKPVDTSAPFAAAQKDMAKL
jgi:enoyl-CoA hydratase/carnithine racemase